MPVLYLADFFSTIITLFSSLSGVTSIVMLACTVSNFSWPWAVVSRPPSASFTLCLKAMMVNKYIDMEHVGKTYASEIIPARLRAKVCAVELLANWIVNFCRNLYGPVVLALLAEWSIFPV